MSEAVSAFSAYSSGTKKKAVKQKNQAKMNAPNIKKSKTAIAKAKVNTKAIANSTPKASTSKPKTAVKNMTNSTKVKSGDLSATNGKTVSNGKTSGIAKDFLGPHNVDEWKAELLGDTKKLTKAQKKRKEELQRYIIKQDEKAETNTNDRSDFSDQDSESDLDISDNEMCNNGHSMHSDNGDEADSSSAMSFEEVQDLDITERQTTTYYKSDSKTSKTAKAAATKRKIAEEANINNNSKENEEAETSAATPNKLPKKQKKKDKKKKIAIHKQRQSSTSTIGPVPIRNFEDNRVKVATKRRSNGTIVTNVSSIVKSEPESPPPSIFKRSSIDEGKRTFAWLVNPITTEDFFKTYWERDAFLIKRNNPDIFDSLISFAAIDEMLIENHIEFTTNIDVTSYKNGQRQTHNPEGRAMPPAVWSHYGDGCSIRLLNPHTYMPMLLKLNTTLQEYFHCLVGANAYLTPPNSQGFAPHYDDIEAFVLQIEGRKRWKLYEPIRKEDMLARESSHNYKPDEIGEAILDEVLMPGDLLYFPRGTIHQACTEPGYHSLHITLSVYQKQAYADLLEQLLPLVLQSAIKEQLDVRRGLPLHTFKHLGLVHADADSKERYELQKHIADLVNRHLMPTTEHIDAAVDQLAKKYQREALPPELNATERLRTIYGSRSSADSNGQCMCDYELTLRTNVRLLRANILRLVREDGGKLRVYYYVDNAREYCKYEPTFMEIAANEAATIELLVRSYPAYVGVSQFPLRNDDRKMDVATALWERGLLMTEKPFK